MSLYDDAVSYAQTYGVPSQLFTDVIQQESGFDPNAYNPASGATGIAQFLPSTAANPGYGIAPVDPSNPQSSLSGAAQYLSALYNKLGSWTGALSAYSGSSSGTPYPGNSAIASDLSALSGTSTGTATPTSGGSDGGTSATGSTASASPASWLSTISTWAGQFATRGALILLAILLLLGGVYLFAARTQQVATS